MTQQNPPSNPPVESLTFESALAELEKIVQNLEGGKIGLEQSIQEYERGNELRLHCESKLKDARLRVEKLSLNAAGQPQREIFDQK